MHIENRQAVDRETLARLAEDLRAADYTVTGVEDLLGAPAASAMHREQLLPARRAVASAEPSPLATLVRALLLAQSVPADDLHRALPRAGLETLLDAGVLSVENHTTATHLDLRPYLDGFTVADLGEATIGGPLPVDHVLGVGGASHTLADATVRLPVTRALDLGTGCGVQALHAAGHAASVIATDTSERALRLASMTFALNGIDTVEVRRGSLFEPVADEEFDLVVSNPPFVITPRAENVPTYEYRDAGWRGDGLARAVVTQARAHLGPGGVAQLLGNWEVPRGASWRDVVTDWLDDEAARDLDAWVIQRDELDPAQYAEVWIRDGGLTRGPEFDRLYAAWLDDFASRDVASIGLGILTLRRPPTGPATLRRLEEVASAADRAASDTTGTRGQGRIGTAIAHGLATHDALTSAGDLLAQRLDVAGDVTEERYHRPGDDDPSVVLLRQGGGLARVVRVGSLTAAAVGACDGDLTLGAIVGALAQITQTPADEVVAEVVPAVRELAIEGFLSVAAPVVSGDAGSVVHPPSAAQPRGLGQT